MRRRKEVQANHARRIRQSCGKLVDIKVRGVGRQDRLFGQCHHQFGKDILFHLHAFKGSLNGKHRVADSRIICRRVEPRTVILRTRIADQTSLQAGVDDLFNIGQRPCDAVFIRLQNRRTKPCIQQSISNASPHSPTTNNSDVIQSDRISFDRLRHLSRALSKEDMAQRTCLITYFQL